MNKPVVLFRSDGNSNIGYGHTMRMLALAEMIATDFDICFIIKDTTQWLINEIIKQYSILQIPSNLTLDNEASFIEEFKSDLSVLIILDGYYFDTSYQLSVRGKSNLKIVSIDDFQPFRYISDIVINHAGLLTEFQFDKESYTKLLLGPQYALLRKEFNEIARTKGRVISKIQTAFICLGGTDPDLYYQIVNKLIEKHICYILVVVNDILKFEDLKGISTSVKIEVYSNLSVYEMIKLMQQSDLAILPASTLCYEYCSVTGGLYVIQTSENQKWVFNFITQSGCGFSYNEFDASVGTSDLKDNINQQVIVQREFFNGRNEANLRKAIFLSALREKIQLCKATHEDLKLYFNWANDTETRQNSFCNEPITLETHTIWYNKKIKDPHSALYILWASNVPLGNIRFDIKNGAAILSYSISKEFRNRGLGSKILEEGIRKIKIDHSDISVINGYIHQKNLASIKSFLKIGFELNSNPPIHFENFNYYSLNLVK
jgi:UDP-2,4-diacetamido-2,4,6-trideoxy-beta-L-altropyranose hydrolase